MKRTELFLIALVAVPFLVGAALVLRQDHGHATAPTYVSPQPFNREAWLSGSATRRIAIARHMTRQGELVGKTATEITELLGPPLAHGADERLTWFLGRRQSGASWFWPYDEYLVVLLDGRDLCTKAYICNSD